MLNCLGGTFDYDAKSERLEEVSRELEAPEVWNEPERAQALGKELSALELIVKTIDALSEGTEEIQMLVEMAVEEQDQDSFDEAEKLIESAYKISKTKSPKKPLVLRTIK